MMAEKSEDKTRVGQSKGFQKLSSKRNVYLKCNVNVNECKRLVEVANTATILKDNYSYFFRQVP